MHAATNQIALPMDKISTAGSGKRSRQYANTDFNYLASDELRALAEVSNHQSD